MRLPKACSRSAHKHAPNISAQNTACLRISSCHTSLHKTTNHPTTCAYTPHHLVRNAQSHIHSKVNKVPAALVASILNLSEFPTPYFQRHPSYSKAIRFQLFGISEQLDINNHFSHTRTHSCARTRSRWQASTTRSPSRA